MSDKSMLSSKFDSRRFKINEIASFNPTDPVKGKKTIFYETPFTAGAIWCLKPGQEVFKHAHSAADDLWICIQGKGTFYPGCGEEYEIEKGDIIISYPNEMHGMVNTGDEDFIFIGVAGPNPMDLILFDKK